MGMTLRVGYRKDLEFWIARGSAMRIYVTTGAVTREFVVPPADLKLLAALLTEATSEKETRS